MTIRYFVSNLPGAGLVPLSMYRFQVRRTLRFDSNGLLIGWSRTVLFILLGPQSGNIAFEFNLALSLNSSFVARDTLWVDCFLSHDVLWGKNSRMANCYKTCQVHLLRNFECHHLSVSSSTNIQDVIFNTFLCYSSPGLLGFSPWGCHKLCVMVEHLPLSLPTSQVAP